MESKGSNDGDNVSVTPSTSDDTGKDKSKKVNSEKPAQDSDDEDLWFNPSLKAPIDFKGLIEGGTASFEIDDVEAQDMDVRLEYMEDEVFQIGSLKAPRTLNDEQLFQRFQKLLAEKADGGQQFNSLVSSMTPVEGSGSNVHKLIVSEGSGSVVTVKESTFVYAHYAAVIEGSDEFYDCTLEQKHRVQPMTFDMSRPDIIPGLYLAVLSMRADELAMVVVEPSFAYGKSPVLLPNGSSIPPNSRLLFIIKLLTVEHVDPSTDKSQFLDLDDKKYETMQYTDFLNDMIKLKETGNSFYLKGEYMNAIKRYRRAIFNLEGRLAVKADMVKMRDDLLYTLYINTAQCFLKMEQYEKVGIACKKALRSQPSKNQEKAFFRYAKAELALGNEEKALQCINDARKHAPDDKEVIDLQNLIESKLKIQEKQTTNVFKKMF